MTQARVLAKIKEVIKLDPPLREDVIEQVKEARQRIAKGKFTRNEDIVEILQGPEMMKQILESEKNIKQGKIKKFDY